MYLMCFNYSREMDNWKKIIPYNKYTNFMLCYICTYFFCLPLEAWELLPSGLLLPAKLRLFQFELPWCFPAKKHATGLTHAIEYWAAIYISKKITHHLAIAFRSGPAALPTNRKYAFSHAKVIIYNAHGFSRTQTFGIGTRSI